MEEGDGFFESVSLLLANCRRFIDVVFQFRGDLDLTVPFCNRRLDSALRIGEGQFCLGDRLRAFCRILDTFFV